ncbi:tripartite tricarboxylate transporter permease, partial [Saccharospirillum sp.]|uniref:tripartite tricarboxylate transporter permease n=1 Tax=Saccharospirillum sp. TaxID=2033801 RepID=UPI0034A07778
MISHLDIVFVMIFTIVIGNLIGTIFGMFLVNPLTRATFLRSSILVPVLICIVFTGAYVVHNAWFEMLIALVFGILGYVMKELSYSRAAMLIGLVLGYAIEKNLYLALQLNGPRFYLEPIPLTLVVITVVFLGWNIWTFVRDRKKEA